MKLAEDRGWMTSSAQFILPTRLFSCSTVEGIFWWTLMGSTKFHTLCADSMDPST